MKYYEVVRLQKEQGIYELQQLINSGLAWRMEGYVGRVATEALESGACYLPKKRHIDYWGNTVPSRDDVKSGSAGSYKNSVRYYLNSF